MSNSKLSDSPVLKEKLRVYFASGDLPEGTVNLFVRDIIRVIMMVEIEEKTDR